MLRIQLRDGLQEGRFSRFVFPDQASYNDQDSLNTQLEESRQRAGDLDQQLSARLQEIQDLEKRTTSAEKERGNVTSLYFRQTTELEQASKRATDLEQQLSARIQDVQDLEQNAAEALAERDNLNKQQAASGSGFIRRLLGFMGTPSERIPRSSHAKEVGPTTVPGIPTSKGPRLGFVRRIANLKGKNTQRRGRSDISSNVVRRSVTVTLPSSREPGSNE